MLPLLLLSLACLAASKLVSCPTALRQEYQPRIVPASDEGEQAMAGFQLPDGFEVTLWAAEPLLANPVCLAFDERGRCFVAESFRVHAGVTDIREHMDWLDEDLASRTVLDRVAMMRRHAGDGFAAYESERERVRRIEDSDGDGRADRATVFADAFGEAASGVGAGLLAQGSQVYYTCIPDLWRLRDADDDGVAESLDSLAHGFGVNVALFGHDLHGLRLGPDGRLYFSIGDRGLSVRTKEGKLLDYPKTGCVLRCDPDGSNLEVFASGLRNPQELVFDDYGNLFTGDNNSDGGDRARFVWILEGSDSGWRYPYQWIESPNARGPWNAEKLWQPAHAGQPAYILPPIDNLADGPSGLTYMPGDAWGEAWRGTFFLCDFRGAASLSGIHSFKLERSGAGFSLGTPAHFLWGTLATDADFAPDGALYVSDWVDGWTMTGKGRVYRAGPKGLSTSEAALEVAGLLREGLVGRDAPELARWLAHADQRVRLAAQFELVRRASIQDDVDRELFRGHLLDAVVLGTSVVQRLHGIWGLGQVARVDSKAPAMVFRALDDPEPEVRAAVLRVLGPAKHAFAAVKAKLADPEPRVRLCAAEALGYYGTLHAVEPLVALLRDTDDGDPWIRHACIRALERLQQRGALLQFASDPSPAVRRAIAVVLRRWQDAEVARYLADPDPSLVSEAARAIYDLPIEAAWSALARALDEPRDDRDEYCLRRMLNANLREGAAGADRIARFLRRRSAGAGVASAALELLATWDAPAPRDRVTGAWRPFEAGRSLAEVAPHVAGLASSVCASGSPALLVPWLELVARTRTGEVKATVEALLAEARHGTLVRSASLDALLALEPERATQLLGAGCKDADPGLRAAALARVTRLAPDQALSLLDGALAENDLGVRAAALSALAKLPGDGAIRRIEEQLRALELGAWPPELELDLYECVAQRGEERLAQRLAAWRERLAAQPLGEARLCLQGGDASLGRRVFFEDATVTCLRCHRVGAEGGTEVGGLVGPDLSQVGARLDREGLLESVLRPNASLAAGYERWILVLDDESLLAGSIVGEDERFYHLLTPSEQEIMVARDTVVERRRDLSAMPEGQAEKISQRALRDLIEFLASLR